MTRGSANKRASILRAIVVFQLLGVHGADHQVSEIVSDDWSCANSAECPTWTYCDSRLDHRCVACSKCPNSPNNDLIRPDLCRRPTQCIQSAVERQNTYFTCSLLTVVPGRQISGRCSPKPLSTGFVLGTECQLQCDGEEMRNVRCIARSRPGGAYWNGTLPSCASEETTTITSSSTSATTATVGTPQLPQYMLIICVTVVTVGLLASLATVAMVVYRRPMATWLRERLKTRRGRKPNVPPAVVPAPRSSSPLLLDDTGNSSGKRAQENVEPSVWSDDGSVPTPVSDVWIPSASSMLLSSSALSVCFPSAGCHIFEFDRIGPQHTDTMVDTNSAYSFIVDYVEPGDSSAGTEVKEYE